MAATVRNFRQLSKVLLNSRPLLCSCGKKASQEKQKALTRFISSKSPNDISYFSGNRGKYIVFGVASCATGCLLYKGYDRNWFSRAFGQVQAAEVYDSGSGSPPSRRKQWNFIAEVVRKASPSVVHIEIQGGHPFTGREVTLSNGSGFIVREDGLILTNAHVVANKPTVKVKLQDGTTYQGVVQAVDQISDLATLKIDAKNLPVLGLGDSSSMEPGEWVVALGSPLQLSNTVTAGIISSKGRASKDLGLQNKDIEYIQTDATINFGNSGGPLVNLDGEAIGINTMKVTTGISFAIPSNYAKEFLIKAKALEERTNGKRGWLSPFQKSSPSAGRYLGITMMTLSPDIANELRLRQGHFPHVDKGVLVYKVVVGSPADDGGLQPGDVITEINGKPTATSSDVYQAIDKDPDLRITIKRGYGTLKLKITPEAIID